MTIAPLHWNDRVGVSHPLRQSADLTATEQGRLDLLRRQIGYAAALLDAGLNASAISQAPPTMMRMMMRILLPTIAEDKIASFEP